MIHQKLQNPKIRLTNIYQKRSMMKQNNILKAIKSKPLKIRILFNHLLKFPKLLIQLAPTLSISNRDPNNCHRTSNSCANCNHSKSQISSHSSNNNISIRKINKKSKTKENVNNNSCIQANKFNRFQKLNGKILKPMAFQSKSLQKQTSQYKPQQI